MPRDRITALFQAALSKHRAGDLVAAEQCYRQLLEVDRHHADALHHLGLLLRDRGNSEEAISLLTRAVAVRPNDAVGQNNLANMLKEEGRLTEALSAYRAAVRCDPDYANAYFNLADLLLDQGELQAATDCYRQVLRLSPEDAGAWNGLGAALRRRQRLAEAMEAFDTALRISPDWLDAHNNRGLVLAALGDLEAATVCFRTAIELDADYASVYENLAKSRRFGAGDRGEILRLQALAESSKLQESARVSLHFALGKMLDDCGVYNQAFEHYRTANRLKRQTVDFEREQHTAAISDSITTFSRDFFEQRQGSDHPSELPVFIVGMPRAGTTLVEQIIASHPQVFGADELTHIRDIATALPARLQTDMAYPGCVPMIDATSVRSLAEDYLGKLRALGGDALRVSDKMPGNFFHLGLIALMFPRARIIHCRRDPLDVCLSIYFHRFVHGYDYAYDLTDIGVYYRQYRRLMQHWHETLPIKICDVQYEELVANQESESRRLIDYCGLPWDDRCLEYHKNDRPVQTMSNWQVRQPIYTDSIQRWKKYEEHLDELKEALVEGHDAVD